MRRTARIAAMCVTGVALTTLPAPAASAARIRACADLQTGLMRLLTVHGKCRSTEWAVSWNPLGRQGPAGPAGPAGPSGTAGAAVSGFPAAVPSGKTIMGAWVVRGLATASGQSTSSAISFVLPITGAMTGYFIPTGAPAPSQCPGTPAAPAAAPGALCVFEAFTTNVATGSGSSGLSTPVPGTAGSTTTALTGAIVSVTAAGIGGYQSTGTWAATAP